METSVVQDIFELVVFDKNGNKIVSLDTLTKGILKFGAGFEATELIVKDGALNVSMLGLFGTKKNQKVVTEFDKLAWGNNEVSLRFGSVDKVEGLKLIAKGIYYDFVDNPQPKEFKIIIPNATLYSEMEYKFKHGDSVTPSFRFIANSFNENDDKFEMVFKDKE